MDFWIERLRFAAMHFALSDLSGDCMAKARQLPFPFVKIELQQLTLPVTVEIKVKKLNVN